MQFGTWIVAAPSPIETAATSSYRRNSLAIRFGTSLLGMLMLIQPLRAAEVSPEDADFFEKRVRPVLVERCYECHGEGDEPEGGLRLTSRAHVLTGGVTGPAAVAEDPDASLLIRAITYQGELRMPPDARLADAEIKTLTEWVRRGLPWPGASADPPPTRSEAAGFQITEQQRQFWAFQPITAPEPPPVHDASWPIQPLDRFILAGLESQQLSPAPRADKRTLIRRATFDLTGLPPTIEEIERFLADESPDAYARLIDRLLDSPAYGERWGRHWLDVVRYTDSFDARIVEGDNVMECNSAWRYRDWVVKAFNNDLPYDQFIVHQIAGDLLPPPEGEERNFEGIIATGMLAIGNWGGGDADKEKLLTDIVDDQIDVVTRGFLGLTVACARCHDHKFDPISTEDYYGLAGIFFSSHILADPGPKTNGPPMLRIPLETNAYRKEKAAWETRVAELKQQIDALGRAEAERLARQEIERIADYLLAAQAAASADREQLAEIAQGRQLVPAILAKWIEVLREEQFAVLSRYVPNLLDNPALHAWQGNADTPSLVVNTSDETQRFLTITLPGRSVGVHPSPDAGVAVGWRSPLTGRCEITGRIVDGDGVCGNGIEWKLERRSAGQVDALASGAIDNGGEAMLQLANPAGPSRELAFQFGDLLQLSILPRGDYSCDTTVVELTIRELEGQQRVWNFAEDLVRDPHEGGQGNPHSDQYGNPDVWYCYDLGQTSQVRFTAPDGSLLARWIALVQSQQLAIQAKDRAAELDASELEQLAQQIQSEVATVADQPSVAETGPVEQQVARRLLEPGSPFWLEGESGRGFYAKEAQEQLAAWTAELGTLEKERPADPGYAHGCVEGGCPESPHAGVHDVHVHIRGRYDRLGPLVPRRFPEILAGEEQPPITEGSGRMQLARWIASESNPLTARVMVNRVWQHHFGQGIVRSPGNFGTLGERPTHPELLDHLARVFIESGWSMKALHRYIMLSATYQQSSAPSEQALQQDPDNRWWSRMNRRRLEAEVIRDSLLAVSGRLDRAMGGRAVRELAQPRRTLYVMTIRSDNSNFRQLFDAADPTAMVHQRIVSTVAPQALFLLNDTFALSCAEQLAARIQSSAATEEERIRYAYELLYARPPQADELRIGQELLASGQSTAEAWQQYCQVLLCTNEFVYVD